MSQIKRQAPQPLEAEDEQARMGAYVRAPETMRKVAAAEAEIDAGKGIVADEAYFKALKRRRAERQ